MADEREMFSFIGDSAGERIRRALALYLMGASLFKQGQALRARRRTQSQFTLAVPGDDEIYSAVHRRLLAELPARKQRALTVRSKRGESRSDSHTLQSYYDGTRSQGLVLEGHRVVVSLERPEWMKGSRSSDEGRSRMFAADERIMFTCETLAGRDAVQRMLAGVAGDLSERAPRLHIASKWGDWSIISDAPNRPEESVILREGQKESLIADIDSFFHQEMDYVRLGIPWHRGYLFHGPPGTGKTSLAKALGSHFDLDVYYLPLTGVKEDSTLTALFSQLQPRSFLVLEDIDIVHGSRERDDKDPGVTLGGLLNALDGFMTPHGLVTVMTTNDRAVLDPALIRPGRVDRDEQIGYADAYQLERLIETLTGEQRRFGEVRDDVTPAEIVEVVKRHLGDPEQAIRQIAQLVAA